ncbi:MAG: hypothetical protein ACT4P4_27970 [Betaproteobacteria bacterium]
MRPLLVALVLFASPAGAVPFAVQVGEARIALDSPPGYADTTFTGSPRLQELAEMLTSPSNRILLFAISDGDLRRFTQGDTPEFRRYMVAVTPRNLERERTNATTFQRVVDDALRELGTPAPAGSDPADYLAQQQPGIAVMLTELRKEPGLVSFLQGTRLPPTRRPSLFGPEEKPQFLLTSNSLLLMRGKTLQLTVHTQFDSPADAEWIRAITLRWIEDLQRLNHR